MSDTLRGRRKHGAPVSQAKAKMMMEEGTIKGHPMTPKQRGMFGAIAGGNSMMDADEKPRTKRRKRRG